MTTLEQLYTNRPRWIVEAIKDDSDSKKMSRRGQQFPDSAFDDLLKAWLAGAAEWGPESRLAARQSVVHLRGLGYLLQDLTNAV